MSLSWSDVGKAIAGIAPILGTALGGRMKAVVVFDDFVMIVGHGSLLF